MTETKAEYEFNPQQEEALGRLARYVGSSGVSSFCVTTVCAALSFFSFRSGTTGLGVLMLVFAVYFGLTAFWVTRASSALRAIVNTRGHDLTHLLEAVSRLVRYYQLKMWLLFAFLAVVLLTIASPSAH